MLIPPPLRPLSCPINYVNKSVKGAPMETLVACASATEAREIAKRLRRSDSSRQVRYSCSRRAAKILVPDPWNCGQAIPTSSKDGQAKNLMVLFLKRLMTSREESQIQSPCPPWPLQGVLGPWTPYESPTA